MRKKRKVLSIVGDLVTGTGMVGALFVAAIDLDQTPWRAAAVALLVCGGLVVLGILISNVLNIHGTCFGAMVVAFAWMHEHFNLHGKLTSACHCMKAKQGSYSATFHACKKLHEDYLRNQEV